VLNRIDERPDFITHIAWLEDGRLTHTVACTDPAAMAQLEQLLHLKHSSIMLPEPDPIDRLPALQPDDALVELNNVAVRYSDNTVFEDISWRIEAGEHWQLTGPNGSGKTCLLSLITGDHPQCYVNDIRVFGYQRGQGESIWQIKQYIGYVSTQLCTQNPATCTNRSLINGCNCWACKLVQMILSLSSRTVISGCYSLPARW